MYLQMLLHVVHLAEVLLAGDTLQDLVVPMGLLIQCFQLSVALSLLNEPVFARMANSRLLCCLLMADLKDSTICFPHAKIVPPWLDTFDGGV